MKLQLGEWLTKEDINGDTKVVFQDEGKFVSQEFDGKEQESFVITVALNKDQKRSWTMNKTSMRAVSTHYGPETKDWIGKEATLFLVDMNVAGKIRKVICAREKA